MLRLVTYLLITLFLVSVLRNIVGFVLRGFSDLMRSRVATAQSARETQSGQSRSTPHQTVPLTGELKKDPVCGIYTAAASSIQQTVKGQTFYFCSATCRDKYLASLPV